MPYILALFPNNYITKSIKFAQQKIKTMKTNSYFTFIYRMLLCYLFYFIARLLFYYFQQDFMDVRDFSEFITLQYYGLRFDTAAIAYANLLFIILSFLPIFIHNKAKYQKIIFWVYFICNGIAYSLNFVDMGYYAFSKSRLTMAAKNMLEHEDNKTALFSHFVVDYWYLFVVFALLMSLWVVLYKRVRVQPKTIVQKKSFLITQTLSLLIVGTASIAGIRGGNFDKSKFPLNIADASEHIRVPSQADLVLNSTFTFIRTLGKTDGFKIVHWVSDEVIQQRIQPIKQYEHSVQGQPNIVIFILESFGREYWNSMNTNTTIENFESYTPFLDSLAQKGFVFDNAFANGRQSIHGLPSILAGIPSFKDTYATSPYVNQPTTSIISIAKQLGYHTSFFHGASNGSIGFSGFTNILGTDEYIGRNEYANDEDFDGTWGIWDEPFLKYTERQLAEKKQPFLSTIFTLSSHHPYKIPEKYAGKFKEGTLQIHKCIGYTDFALKQFFERAKKEPWFANTIFVFTADHTNESYYEEYKSSVNQFAVPILFYSPNNEWIPKGISHQITQHLDIYPTLVHLMGYSKPFRSWGRSLFADKGEPRAIHSTGNGIYQMLQGNYIYVFDGKNILGIYAIDDKSMQNNLYQPNALNDEMQQGITDLKAFIQDYMHRVIDKKMVEDRY